MVKAADAGAGGADGGVAAVTERPQQTVSKRSLQAMTTTAAAMMMRPMTNALPMAARKSAKAVDANAGGAGAAAGAGGAASRRSPVMKRPQRRMPAMPPTIMNPAKSLANPTRVSLRTWKRQTRKR